MQKPLSLKLRPGDKVIAVQRVDTGEHIHYHVGSPFHPESGTMGSLSIKKTVIFTEMGFFYELKYKDGNPTIAQVMTEDAD